MMAAIPQFCTIFGMICGAGDPIGEKSARCIPSCPHLFVAAGWLLASATHHAALIQLTALRHGLRGLFFTAMAIF